VIIIDEKGFFKLPQLQNYFKPSHLQDKLSRGTYLLSAMVTFVVFFAVWGLIAASGFINELFLPSPIAVIGALLDSFLNFGYAWDVLVSSYRILLGFLLSAALAIPVGLLMGTYKPIEALLEPFNDFIRYMPVVAFVPLCILWMGIGNSQKILVIFIGTYFQLVLMVAAAVAQVPREYLETYSMLSGGRAGHLRKIILPAAWPTIFDSLRIAAGWAWSYLVVAELVAAETGIGFKIMQAQRFLKTPQVIAGIIVVGLLGILTDYLFKAASHRLFPWVQEK
jgi:NitT/TauT family transport system permease protein